jgi:DUF4097 and DUF4098 domain-containing protein YvlB
MQRNLLIVLALSGLPALAQNPTPRLDCDERNYQNDRLVSHCEMKEQTLAASKGAIRIDPGMNGGVTVNGWDRADVWVRARIDTAADTDSEARSMVPTIRFASGSGQIRAEGPEMDKHHNWAVTYEIFAPRQSDLQMKTFNGGIHLADLRGTISFEALNGGVTLERLAGEIHGHTTNGGLHITLAGDRWEGSGLDVETTNGGVRLDLPSSYSAHIETSTVNGGMDVEFPITVHGRIDRNLSFDIGNGGPTIRATTTNGGVRIRKS